MKLIENLTVLDYGNITFHSFDTCAEMLLSEIFEDDCQLLKFLYLRKVVTKKSIVVITLMACRAVSFRPLSFLQESSGQNYEYPAAVTNHNSKNSRMLTIILKLDYLQKLFSCFGIASIFS